MFIYFLPISFQIFGFIELVRKRFLRKREDMERVMMGILFGSPVLYLLPLNSGSMVSIFMLYPVFRSHFDFFAIRFLMTGKLNIIGWNCRGSTGKDKLCRICRIMKDKRVDIFALVETRANEDPIYRLCTQFVKFWNWVSIPATGYSGGIIVFWLKTLGRIFLVAYSHRALHLIFSSSADHPWIISVVYNAQHLSFQQKLWKELSLVQRLDLPWIVLGDFNAITSQSEHKGSNFSYYARKAYFFSKFISDNALLDVSYWGPPFRGVMANIVLRGVGLVSTVVWLMNIG